MGEPPWEETTTLDHGRGQELLVKEALHIQMMAAEERFNRDGGLEVPGCWTVWHTIHNKKKKGQHRHVWYLFRARIRLI